jgi:subtilisin family serine protease
MKKALLLLVFVTSILNAQVSQQQNYFADFVPGEIIVKLKDNFDASVRYAKNGSAVSSMDIGEFLGVSDKVKSSSMLFHQKSIESSVLNKQKMLTVYAAKAAANSNNGFRPKEPVTMKNIFVLKMEDAQENILSLIDQIKGNPNVEFAEPNYLLRIDDFEIGNIISAEEASKFTSSSVLTNDPLYAQQSNITITNIDDVWNDSSNGTTGDGSQIVAVIDTGGDYTHPDLAANTWINQAELNGIEGFDDDGNGYIDDIRGWDFINEDNTPLDDNAHGTHVAGIIGAVGNNSLGIRGAAWNVKLMHIKVMQSNGSGNALNIAEGIEYASNNGATIINMSIGGYSESITMQAALENAYATSLLVAAAGNDGKCIGPGRCPDGTWGAPLYPGAYSYVLGVEDSAGDYDNYDNSGPVATSYANLLNYEVKAPGSGILSTLPGGGYGNLTGTSMATPLVAGGMALYLEKNPNDSKELIFGNLINTSTGAGGSVDFYAAINVDPTPQLAVLSASTRDTISGQNGNGILEPGETIEILPLIRNYWGPSDDIRVGIEFAQYEDQTKATITNGEISIGSISAYATLQDLQETIKITLSANIANDVNIGFVLTAWSGPNKLYESSPVDLVINVKNSILLHGLISSDYTFTADKEYLVPENLIFSGDAVVTVEPGVTIKVSTDKKISFFENSTLICNGTKDARINFIGESGYWGGILMTNAGQKTISFTNFKNMNWGTFGMKQNFSNVNMSDVLFYDIRAAYLFYGNPTADVVQNRINVYESRYQSKMGQASYIEGFNNLNIANTHSYYDDAYNDNGIDFTDTSSTLSSLNLIHTERAENSLSFSAGTTYTSFGSTAPVQAYIGTTDVTHIRNTMIADALNSDIASVIDLSQIAAAPHEVNHAIVWKVLVNGRDAQDEYELMDPVGVGTHEFKVYFNRTMDTTVDPEISYGVTIPYTQKTITETGTWSSDGKIYTVTHNVGIGAADGINRIRVQDAQDLDYFKIPVEDHRFNMLIQSAGSASIGWFATPHLGKIDLEWTAPSSNDINDVLGYNMYRYQLDVDGNETGFTKINETLIIEDSDNTTSGIYYTDFNVIQGQTYFYKYKILKTSLTETDYSSVVSSIPLTSELGDANGDSSVNVLDLVQDVDYILGNNPSPFIVIAADVNNDSAINVLDIVGTVDIILNAVGSASGTTSGNINYYSNIPVGDALFSWEGNDLYVTSNDDIGGIQLAFNEGFEYVLSSELPIIEHLNYAQDASEIVMLYSFNNTTIANTKTKILTRLDGTQDFNIEQAVVGTTFGAKLNATLERGTLDAIDAPFQSNQLEILNFYPNPSKGLVNLKYYLPEQMDQVMATVYDLQGRKVWVQQLTATVGNTVSSLQLNKLSGGSYIVLMSAHKDGGVKYLSHKTLILE